VLRYGDNDFLMADILWRISRNLMANIESLMAVIKRRMANIAAPMANIEFLMAKITSRYGENALGLITYGGNSTLRGALGGLAHHGDGCFLAAAFALLRFTFSAFSR